MDLSAYVRHRGRPPRAVNDNRRMTAAYPWGWAFLIGAIPVAGLMAALSTFI